MSKVFIASSSYDNIPEIYFEEAKKVANICINKNYDLVFGCRNKGLMGIIYKQYLNTERKITAICMKEYESDIEELQRVDEVKLFNTTIEQMDYFMNETDILIYLPGGYGTLTELSYLINAKVMGIHNKEIIIVNSSNFYDKILEHFNKLFKEGFITKKPYIEVSNIDELNNIL